MKYYKFIIVIVLVGFFFPSFSFAAENEHDYPEFIDIVYEWTPYGNYDSSGGLYDL